MKYSQEERLKIVLDIVYKLKNFKGTGGQSVNLYNDSYTFISEFKKITNEYIKQDEDNLKEFRGKIMFEEIGKNIEYIFPVDKLVKPLFVIRQK
jgi:hypothetical protein